MNWQQYILHRANDIIALLQRIERVAVLGIRPERMAYKPAFYVPKALQHLGLTILPVPVEDTDHQRILGQPTYRRVADIPGPIDLVDVFRRAEDIPAHLDDLIAARPQAVWFQQGIRNDEAAQELAKAGILVVQDRCLMVDYRWLKAQRVAASGKR